MLPKIDVEGLKSFIPEDKIFEFLKNPSNDKGKVREIIAKSLAKNCLNPEEMAALLTVNDKDLLEEIKEGARTLKQTIYGSRIVFFAPLYVSNNCVNNCVYCGFRVSNTAIERTALDMNALEQEVKALERQGHKRLILVYGEHPDYDANYIYETTKKVYETKEGRGEIRRVNINAAPLDVEGFRRVKEAGIGTYQIFQETYHQETYRRVHPSGMKADYLWRLHAFDRAMEAGIDDVGMGALLGLYNYRFEALAMLYHAMHLEEKFGVGPHTISFPRITPALGTDFAQHPPYMVSDEDFKNMIAVIRLAVPYTGMILTARESKEFRREAIALGVSQIDAGSEIGIGSYSKCDKEGFDKKSQFTLHDDRPLDAVIGELCEAGYLPSFCTGCYRLGRTGEHFMEFACPGFVKDFCTPNGILTLSEYMTDYASDSTKAKAAKAMEMHLAKMEEGALKEKVKEKLGMIKSGKRDLFF